LRFLSNRLPRDADAISHRRSFATFIPAFFLLFPSLPDARSSQVPRSSYLSVIGKKRRKKKGRRKKEKENAEDNAMRRAKISGSPRSEYLRAIRAPPF